MKQKVLRFAKASDAAAILNIYQYYISETAISFECDVPSVEAFTERVKKISTDYPYIVCLENNKLIGYAYGNRHMARDAYQWNAELTVYLDKDHTGGGVGKVLYNALMEILKHQNIYNVYGGVTAHNTHSERLHECLGFKKIGTYHKAGFKYGEWQDVSWFEKTIREHEANPQPFKSIQTIDERIRLDILKHHNDSLNS